MSMCLRRVAFPENMENTMTEGTSFDVRHCGPASFIPPSPLLVFGNDQGRWTFSFSDCAASFETMHFALAVATQELARMGARQ
jgi:hypothetical protein